MRSFCSKVAVLWVSQHKNAPFCSKVAVLWVRQHENTPFCADEALYELNWWNCRQLDDACLNRFLNFRIFVGSPSQNRVM